MLKRGFLVLLLPLWLCGCGTTITNLTPHDTVRNATGLYPFEVAWDSSQATIKDDTIKAYVIIGLRSFPMQPTPLVRNRWETVIPIPANQDFVPYRYKFDYLYKSIPVPKPSSKLSPPYELHIMDQ